MHRLVALLIACAAPLSACGPRASESVVLGDWTVVDHVRSGISGMTVDEADSWRTSRAAYTPQRAAFRTHVCATPGYAPVQVPRGRFEADHGIPPQRLGVAGENVSMVIVSCKGEWGGVPGAQIVVVADDKIAVVWNGIAFLLIRDAR